MRAFRIVAGPVVAVVVALVTPAAWAGDDEKVTIGFSNLIVRPQGSTMVTIADGSERVALIEHMRAKKLPVVGAESLVFERDLTAEADLLLGGTVTDIDCLKKFDGTRNGTGSCRLAINWEVLDTATDRVIYKHRSWSVVRDRSLDDTSAFARPLLLGALDELLGRSKFRELLARPPESETRRSDFVEASLEICATTELSLPKDAERALTGVVIVENADGFGSGFLVGPSPYVLTAAHVADHSGLRVKLRSGDSAKATVVRFDRVADVALLRLDESVSLPGCLPVLTEGNVAIGHDVFAMGSPISKHLAFTLTRGIVGGIREVDEIPLLQTDASVSSGNSGGPLVDERGRVVGILRSKIIERSAEGLAFATSVRVALARLNLKLGSETSSALATETYRKRVEVEEAFIDPKAERPELDLEAAARRKQRESEVEEAKVRAAERRREEAEAEERRRRLAAITPWTIPTMRWGGAVIGGGGLVMALATGLQKRDVWSREDLASAQLWNDVGWIAAGVGATAVVASFVLSPSLPDDASWASRWNLEVTPTRVGLRGAF